MPDAAPLLQAAERLADRFRAMPLSRLNAPVPGYPSRAAAGRELARMLAARAQRYEGAPQSRELPDAGPFAVGDQLAVAVHDLVAAAAARPDAEDGLRDALGAVETVSRLCC